MKRVLIVDDDEWISEHFVRTLTRAGYDTYTATNALVALDVVDEVSPDVIILDILLTGPNGFVLLHELRSHDDLKGIPVVLCSNTTEFLTEDMVQRYGVSRILDKTSMTPDDLVAATKRALFI